MLNKSHSRRLAVLIDAENVSTRIADQLFKEIAKIGEASVRRIYGDFSNPCLKAWTDVLSKHAIIPQQQFANTPGKNASDIALVIDAMDLLHSGRFDGFCIVSSDGDFTRLAARIREHGQDVFGFGNNKAPDSFRKACQTFLCIEGPSPAPVAAAAKPVPAPKPKPKPLQPVSAAADLIKEALAQIKAKDGWTPLSDVGSHLSKIKSDFDTRKYGFRKLHDLVRETRAFEMNQSKGTPIRVSIRLPVTKAPTEQGKRPG